MKNLLVLVCGVFVFLFSSCANDPLDQEFDGGQSDEPVMEEERYKIEDGMFVFESEKDFYRAIYEIGALSEDARLELESSLGFLSLQTLCEDLSERLEAVESEEDYIQVKGQYEKFVIWGDNSIEGQAYFIPLDDMKYFPVVNSNCQVMINGEVKSFYSDGLKRAWYEGDKLKSSTISSCKKFRSKDVQLLANITRVNDEFFDCYLLYISTQKHRRLTGWNNVKRKKTIKNTANSAIFFGSFVIFTPEMGLPQPILRNETLVYADSLHVTKDEKYTRYHIPRDSYGNLPSVSLAIWGNGFNESQACHLNCY